MKKEIILAGGCYWCVEAIYRKLAGVIDIESGHYILDKKTHGFTDHDKIEVVHFFYDPDSLPFNRILDIFFFVHTPTLVKWDINDCFYPLCRSAIIYFDQEQKKEAENYIEGLTQENRYEEPIQTKLISADSEKLKIAPEKEQDYYGKYPEDAYCKSIIQNKMNSLFEKFRIK